MEAARGLREAIARGGSGGFLYSDHSLCSTVIEACARIQVVAGFWCRSLRRGSLLALHS